MDVKVFKTFLEVAKTRHFGRASENLFITQAAVSARVKQLEEFIGAPLFERTRNNIQLTSAGKRLIPYAETMVRALRQVKTGVTMDDDDIQQISIAASPNVWDAFLQNYLTVITDAFPKLTFRTEIASVSQLNMHVIDGTADIILLFDAFLAEEVHSIKTAEIDLKLVSTTKGLPLEEPTAHNYVFVDWGTKFSHEHEAKYGDTFTPVLYTSTGRIALDYILAKGGTAFLPETSVQPFIDSGQLFEVSSLSTMTKSVYANYHKDNKAVRIIKEIINVLDQSKPQIPVILESASTGME